MAESGEWRKLVKAVRTRGVLKPQLGAVAGKSDVGARGWVRERGNPRACGEEGGSCCSGVKETVVLDPRNPLYYH